MAVTRTIVILLCNPLESVCFNLLIYKEFIFAFKTGAKVKTAPLLAETVIPIVSPQSYPQRMWIAGKTV